MPRPYQLPFLFLACALGVGLLGAAEFTPFINPPKKPVPAERPRLSASRAISPELAQKLASVVPPYLARNPAPANANPAATTEEEAARNGIFLLPRFEVRDSKLPALHERDMLTEVGRQELARKRNPGLGSFRNSAWIQALNEEEFGIQRQREMHELMGPGKGPPPVFQGRPQWSLPAPASGPYKGLVVPWERK